MARNWKDVRAEVADRGHINEDHVAEIGKGMQEAERAHRLAALRKSQGTTQTAVSRSMKVTQARVSQIERGQLSKTELGTLESYVEALGGHLKIVAQFGDESITVQG